MDNLTRQKISKSLKLKGIKPPSNLGGHFTKEHVAKIIESKRKNGSLYHTKERTMKIQSARKMYYDQIGRSSPVRDLIERTDKYNFWRMSALKRDLYRCQVCGDNKNLEVHHKIALKDFISACKNDFNEVMQIDNLFDISNAQTLCQKCHKRIESDKIRMHKDEFIRVKGEGFLELRNVVTGEIHRDYFQNMFVTAGKNSLADALRGNEASNKGIITYCALGTSAVAPALGNTSLGTEIVRKLISVRSASSNVATFQTFFTTSEGNGTLREAGLFGDNASSTANSGTLFCRTAINRTKSSNDTLTLSWAVTIG